MTGNPMALSLNRPVGLGDPLDIDDARQACRAVAMQRRGARSAYQKALEQLADREREYRKARSVAYVLNTGAPSAGMRDALVDDETADARHKRDIAAGMVKANEELLKEIDAERASLHRLIDWSAQIDPHAAEHDWANVKQAA